MESETKKPQTIKIDKSKIKILSSAAPPDFMKPRQTDKNSETAMLEASK